MIGDLLLPPRLRPGDRVAAVTLSWGGPGAYPDRYAAGVRQLEAEFGVTVVDLPHTRAAPPAVAADVNGRVQDLHAAFADPEIAGIVSTIGGEDSIRLLPHLDLALIRDNPKVLLGYSDTTITQLACLHAGLQTFYGPSVMSGFGESGGLHDYLRAGVEQMLFTPGPPGAWPANTDGWTSEFIDWADVAGQGVPRRLQPSTGPRWHGGGEAVEGPLIPACLEVLDMLRGSQWWPDLEGAVLALETSEEGMPPEGVARFLRVLALTGDLGRIAALLVGRPGGETDADRHLEHDRAVLDVVRDEQGLALPVVTNLDFGHTDPMWTLPVGGRVRVDPEARTIVFPDPVTGG